MSCPDPKVLVALAFGDADVDELTLRHVTSCPACRQEIRRLQEGAALLAAAPANGAGEGCLDDADIARIATLGLGEADRHATGHLSECARCRARVADAALVLTAPDIAAALEHTDRPVRHTKRRWAVPGAVAAAIIALTLLPRLAFTPVDNAPASSPERERDNGLFTPLPAALEPQGEVRSADRLVWTRVPGADHYTITVFSTDGSVLWQSEATDTAVALPAVLRAGEVYLWKVAAHTSWDRTSESELVEFRLLEPRE
jgi:hypothetical protein